MARYKTISESQLGPGKNVRIINAHSNGTKITFEGPIVEVITEPGELVNPGREDSRHIGRPVAVKFIGDITAAITAKKGWSCTHIEEILPDLPDRIGSVIKYYDTAYLRDRAAVLREVSEGAAEWVRADDDVRVKRSELDRAEVVFVA